MLRKNKGETPIEITASTDNTKKTKKKFYKQKWFWIVVALLLVFGLFGGNGNDDKTATDDSTAAVEEQEEEKSQEQEQTASSEASSDTNSIAVTDDVLLASLNASYEGQGTWEIAGDRHFVFYPEGDLADAFTFIGTYYMQYGEIPAEVEDSYNNMRDSLMNLSKTMTDTAGETCALSVANPSNHDNVLMTFADGVTLYNAFEE